MPIQLEPFVAAIRPMYDAILQENPEAARQIRLAQCMSMAQMFSTLPHMYHSHRQELTVLLTVNDMLITVASRYPEEVESIWQSLKPNIQEEQGPIWPWDIIENGAPKEEK